MVLCLKRCFIELEIGFFEQPALHRFNDRPKKFAQRAEPLVHRLAFQVKPVALENFLLTIQREVIEILRYDNVGEQDMTM